MKRFSDVNETNEKFVSKAEIINELNMTKSILASLKLSENEDLVGRESDKFAISVNEKSCQ